MGIFIGVIVVVVFLSIISVPKGSSSNGLKPWDDRMARKIGRRLSRRKW